MGYYIEAPTAKGKLEYLMQKYGAEHVDLPEWKDIPEDKALIVVADNGLFEAAGYCYSQSEYEVFTAMDDPRPCEYLLMDKEVAEELSGFAR
jgi:hypothetical protein